MDGFESLLSPSAIRSDTETTLDAIVPDTITSWVASAFVISESGGLGVTTAPVEVPSLQSSPLGLVTLQAVAGP